MTEAAPDPQTPTRTDWPLIVVLLTAGAVSAANLAKVPAILPALRLEFGLTAIEAGWVTALFNLLGMTVAVLVGASADQIGQKRLLYAGLLAQTAGAAIGSVSHDVALLVATRAAEGVGFLMVSVSVPPLIVASARRRDVGAALGLWGANVPLGFAAALVVMPMLLEPIGWRGAWLLTGAATGLALGALILLMRTVTLAPRDPGNVVRRIGRSLSNFGLVVLTAIFIFYSVQWTSLMVWLPTYFIETNNLSLGLAAALTAIIVMGNAVGNVTGGQLLARSWPTTRIMTLGGTAMGVCGALILLVDLPLWMRVVLCIGFSGFGGLLPAGMIASVPRYVHSTNQLAAANGLILQGANIGQFFGPPLLIWAVTVAGGAWQAAAVPMVAAAALCVVLASILRRHEGALIR